MQERRGWREYIGDYALEEEIGRGAFGIVYRATQTSLNRQVALKVLPASLFPSKEGVNRFHAEAEAAAQLRHPHIVRVYEAGTDEDLHYFSMDLMTGPSLAEIIRKRSATETVSELEDSHFTNSMAAVLKSKPPGARQPDEEAGRPQVKPVSTAECFAIASKTVGVADALRYSHEKGVVHEDVKPSNLVFDDRGRPCLLDFATAKLQRLRHDSSDSEIRVVTPLYASPEQLDPSRGPIGPHTDIYCLGAALYEWLTLRPPFMADTYQELRDKVLSERPPFPSRVNPQIPSPLANIVMKALSPDPKERYASAKLLAEDLEHFLRSEPVAAESPGLARRFLLWCRRNRSVVRVLFPAILIGIASLAVVGYYFATRPTVLERARKLYELEAFHESIDQLSKVPKESYNWADAMLLKADCLNRLEDHKKRLELYNTLLQAPEGTFNLARLYIGKAKALDDLDRHEEAREAFRKAIEIEAPPQVTALAWYELAKSFDKQHKANEALQHYGRTLELDPDLAKAHFHRGMLFYREKRYQEALPHVKKAVELRGGEKPKYYEGLGILFLAMDKPDDAISAAEKAIAGANRLGRDKNAAKYEMLKARGLIQKGMYEEAMRFLKAAEDYDSYESEARYLLGKAQFLGQNTGQAEDTARKCLEEDNLICTAMLWAVLGEKEKILNCLGLLDTGDLIELKEDEPLLWNEFMELFRLLQEEDPEISKAFRKWLNEHKKAGSG